VIRWIHVQQVADRRLGGGGTLLLKTARRGSLQEEIGLLGQLDDVGVLRDRPERVVAPNA